MKIVFVDDSKIVLETFKSIVMDMIESDMIECDFYNDPRVVQKMLEKETLEYDLMFFAINMPYVTGYELAKLAKSKETYRYKKISAITSDLSDAAKERGVLAGIDAWYVKSINQDDLHSSIVDTIKKLYKKS